MPLVHAAFPKRYESALCAWPIGQVLPVEVHAPMSVSPLATSKYVNGERRALYLLPAS